MRGSANLLLDRIKSMVSFKINALIDAINSVLLKRRFCVTDDSGISKKLLFICITLP